VKLNRHFVLLVALLVASLLVVGLPVSVSAESTKKLELYVGKTTAYVNGVSIKLDVPPVSYPRLKSWACSSKPLQGLLTETHPPASLNRPGGDWLRRFCFS